jgi:hypothetical protein
MALEVAILGPVEPRMDGGVIGVPAGKQRALLTLLALRSPQPVSAESAAEALWPRAAPAEALRNLQVSRLRRSLGPVGSTVETAATGSSDARGHRAVDNGAHVALDDPGAAGAHPGVEPIAGTLQQSTKGDPKPFTGWLQLTQMLETIRRSATDS